MDERTIAARVLNPFTRRLTELPWAATLLSCRKKRTRKKKKCYAPDLADDGELSVTGAGLAGDLTLALSFHGGSLAVAKPGDARWTTLVSGHSSSSFLSSLPFAGPFYCVVDGAVMAVNNVAENNKPPQLEVVAMLARHCSLMMLDTVHLVENGSEMMLVQRCLSFAPHGRARRKCDVYRLDVDSGNMVPVRGLDGRAVFIAKHHALSVFPSVVADVVYPSFEFCTRYVDKMETYRLADGSVVEPSGFSCNV